MPPIQISSRHRVPQLDYMTYRCVLKRYLILKIAIDSEHFLFIKRSIFFLVLAIGLSLITWGGAWFITSYVPSFPFLSPVYSFLSSLWIILFFATFWTLLIYHAFYCLALPVGLQLEWGRGWMITSYVCSVINAALYKLKRTYSLQAGGLL